MKKVSYEKHFNGEATIVRYPAKIGALSISQSTFERLALKIWLIDITSVMDVIKT